MRQSRDHRSRVAWILPRRPLCGARFITRMASVAGSVADEILAAMVAAAPLTRAWVNNGGDIAVHLSPGAAFDVAMAGGLPDSRDTKRPHSEEARRAVSKDELQGIQTGPSFVTQPLAALQDELSVTDGPSLFGTTRITYTDPIRGIATSGFGGRSFSLGIADAVTVLDARRRERGRRRDAGRQCRQSARPSRDLSRTGNVILIRRAISVRTAYYAERQLFVKRRNRGCTRRRGPRGGTFARRGSSRFSSAGHARAGEDGRRTGTFRSVQPNSCSTSPAR